MGARDGVASGTPARHRELRAQGRATMQRLLDAGTHVFNQRGFPAARVDDIVRAARTSHGTFYLYFTNKEDLLAALAAKCAEEVAGLSRRIGAIDPERGSTDPGPDEPESSPGEQEPVLYENLRLLLAELDAYLEQLPSEARSERVLPLASTWVLKDAGFDLARYGREARQFIEVTPEHDRVLLSFPNAITYYIALRLTMSADDELEPEVAQGRLDAARAPGDDADRPGRPAYAYIVCVEAERRVGDDFEARAVEADPGHREHRRDVHVRRKMRHAVARRPVEEHRRASEPV